MSEGDGARLMPLPSPGKGRGGVLALLSSPLSAPYQPSAYSRASVSDFARDGERVGGPKESGRGAL